jgi:hypothetical protein
MFPAGAIVMFPSAAPTFAMAPAEAAAVPVALAFEDCPGAVEEGEAVEAVAEADAGAAEDREEADPDGAEADEDWPAEQPATARAAKTAQAVVILTLDRRAMPSAGAHGDRANSGGGVSVAPVNCQETTCVDHGNMRSRLRSIALAEEATG